jgi:hypothetical protein
MLVYVLTVVLHEIGGHGGACIAFGGHAHALGAYYFDCGYGGMTRLHMRLVAAAGSTVNLIVALITFPLIKRASSLYGKWFWWLLFTANLLDWSGYFLFSGFSRVGDWGWGPRGAFSGMDHQWVWRVVLVLGGSGLYYASALLAARRLGQFVCSPSAARRMSLSAYITGGVLSLLVGLLNPIGMVIVLTSSLASTLGGTSGLLWLTRLMLRETDARPSSNQFQRSRAWIIVGLVITLLFAFVLGPSRVTA